VRAERLEVVPSGIDLEGWRSLPDPIPLAAELGITPGTVVVGTLAALAPHKHLDNLLAAASELARSHPDVRWVVFGEGELRRELEAERRRLGLETVVLLPGFTQRVTEAMALLSVFVLSSYLEGLGTSVLDAQAAGIPVVATRVGGVPEMIEDGDNGWLVPARDPRALAAAVADARARPDEARRRAQRARETVRRFSIGNMVSRTEAVYRELLGTRAKRAG
jgi:glycosyltransferase involved in cell wall biosynthesis